MSSQQLCVPVPIKDKEFLAELVEKGKDWTLLHGIARRSKDHFSHDTITFAPFLLFPSTFPETEFKKAKKIQTTLNQLMHTVAHDHQFLLNSLSEITNVDPFMARLVQIYQEILTEGVTQKVSLGLFRSDYMVDSPIGTIKQVEFNTIASSFGALTSILPNWHRQVLSLCGLHDKIDNIPLSNTLTGYASGILQAYDLYHSRIRSKSFVSPAILFVIEDNGFNVGDQRLLEFEIQRQAPHVRVIRRSLTDIGNHLQLGDRRRLYITGIEIAIVYYRAGYSPAAYYSELEWDARLQMERSLAIKCPSVQYQLAGSKKIQQELARPGILEKFITDPEELIAVRDVFTGLYSLDMNDPKSDDTIRLAINEPSKFVLKPQREGGGNNLYDEDISEYLKKIKTSEERHAWILMDKIQPPSFKNYIVRPGFTEPTFSDVVSELGIFGVTIGDFEKIILNNQVGHMIRTKESSSNEGGVAIGLGALDSVYLQ